MGLYNNIIQWDWNLEAGESVSWIKYPFGEYNLDPIFKVLSIYNDFTVDLEVIESQHLVIGTTYLKQPLEGLRRVKLSTIVEVSSSAYSPSSVSPQPTPIQILTYEKGI